MAARLSGTGGNGARADAMVNLRATLDWLGDEVHYIANPVSPILEMTAIAKAFDSARVLVADNVTGYPDARLIANMYATRERTAKLFGVDHIGDCKHEVLRAYANPIKPRQVEAKDAPCQDVVMLRDEFADPHDILPVVQHTAEDGGRIFGSGHHLIMGEKWVPDGGSSVAMYRMAFRGDRKYAAINIAPGGPGDVICSRHPGGKIPVTINICPPLGVEMMGVGYLNPVIFPGQTDKLAMAGGLQGAPVDIVRARTVDAWAVAQSEWVLEGYIVDGERVWETEEAERLGKQGVALLHPEWARTKGYAYRTPRAFELTAITRRADKALYYTPCFGSIWYTVPFICASIYELCDRIAPGFVTDVAGWLGLTSWGGNVIQVKKQKRSDEGLQRNILGAVMGLHRGMRLCIVVDEDINIWQPEDVMWALQSRVSPKKDITIYNEYGRGQAFQPSEYKVNGISVADGGIGIDATVPLGVQAYERAKYPVDEMDFSKWFSQAELAELRGLQDPYFRWLGEMGFA